METLRDRSFKHFDLPVNHLTRHGHYVPPKARDQAEIDRRRSLRRGTLVAEQQHEGTVVAARMIDFLADKDDSDFLPMTLAAAGLNTAWHNIAQGETDVMRRRLWLEVHARRRQDVTRTGLLEIAADGFAQSAELANLLRLTTELGSAAMFGFKKKYARRIGNSSLVLAAVTRADLIAECLDPVGQQFQTRVAAMRALDAARNLEETVGANPTMAQLADRDSPLAVYIRRNGTNTTIDAWEAATAEGVLSLR